MRFQKLYTYSVRVFINGEAESVSDFERYCDKKLQYLNLGATVPGPDKNSNIKQSIRLVGSLTKSLPERRPSFQDVDESTITLEDDEELSLL